MTAIDLTNNYDNWRQALADGCESLFRLNRHVKKLTNQTEIYELKNKFIKLLWEEGYCVQAGEFQSVRLEKCCTCCKGSGEEDGCVCPLCRGSGVLYSGGHYLWSLRFKVDGNFYSWHHPNAYWASTLGEPIETHDATAVIKPVKRFRIKEAKSLLKWILLQRSQEVVRKGV